MQPETATLHPTENSTNPHKFLQAAVNGTTLYVLAYYLVWGLHQAAKAAVAARLGLRGAWDPSRIVFTMADRDWWQLAIIGVYGIGPFLCLLVGAAAFWWYWKRQRAKGGMLKLFLIWVAFHACNVVFGALLADSLRQEGFWYVPDWVLRLGNAANLMVAFLAGFIQVGLGGLAALPFLQAHDSRTVMKFHNRRRMILYTILTPWLAGSAFIALAKVPYFSTHELLHFGSMGLLLFPLMLGCLNEPFSSTVRRAQASHVAWGLLTLTVLLAVAWRLLLSPPLTFG